MTHAPLQDIVIVGGGTAGWMTAAALSTVLRGRYRILVVESDEIGTVGVGEATIPQIQRFNAVLGLDEREFLRETQGTFKLGIEFVNWGRLGERYMHGFGRLGQDLWTLTFDQYWHRLRAQGRAQPLEQYSITRMAAKANKFMPARPDLGNSPLADIAYAYHFDATLYARHLRRLSESRGVRRTEGRISHATRRGEGAHAGHIDAVVMASGERITGDLFIDCSGFRGLLIEQTLQTGFEDWAHWLPCDRALAVPCSHQDPDAAVAQLPSSAGAEVARAKPLTPYTRATAHRAGWQWRIPLQHRIGNGHVYCSQHVSDDEAAATLLANLDGRPLSDPRPLRFRTGMRRLAWHENVVAIGLSSGFLEPLESTSIHLIQQGIQQLIDFFPDRGFSPADIDEFNRANRFHYERIRDFIILHYHLNQRDDAPFWQACATMAVPDTLREKMDLYRSRGRVVRRDNELFAEAGWIQVMQGQNLHPESHHPLAGLLDDAAAQEHLERVRQVIAKCVDVMPDHAAYIAQHCAA